MTTSSDAVDCVDQDPNTILQNSETTRNSEEPQKNASDHEPHKALTLDNPNLQNSDQQYQESERDPNEEIPDDMVTEIMPDQHLTTTSATAGTTSSTPVAIATSTNRRVSHRLQKRLAAVEKRSLKKLQSLNGTFKPMPFTPVKRNLDFSCYEPLLKRLGLWDFVHLEFDKNIRTDLLMQLIATYNPGSRCSYVNGTRIGVNRADLARALKLPVKKDKVNFNVNSCEGSLEDLDEKETQESIEFIEEIVSNWMLLHDDAMIMPADMSNLMKLIKKGKFEKMDWAGLIWCMMEKELSASHLVNCYYASHMQFLIKCQKEDLLREEVKTADEVKDEEEDDCDGDVRMLDQADISKSVDLEEHKLELSLGQEAVIDLKESAEKDDKEVDHNEDFEGNDIEEQQGWYLDGNIGENEHVLRRCNAADDAKSTDFEEEKQEAEEGDVDEDDEEDDEEEGEEGFGLSSKVGDLERLTSANLIQGMEAMQVPFSTGVDICDNNLPGDFLASRVDAHAIPNGFSSHFGNGNKRHIGEEAEAPHQSLNPAGNKRLRSVEPWENKTEFDLCVDHIQQCIGKARMIHAAKEQAIEDSNLEHQILLNEIQKRDNMIDHLHKARLEEQQKRQMEVYRLERELYLMSNILDGYRNALKQTQKAYAKYRDQFALADEPLYKDVSGGGGLVLTSTEIVKLRQEEERINREFIEKKIKEFELSWMEKFQAHEGGVNLLSNRLIDVESKIQPLKESLGNKKTTKVSEPSPNE